MKDKKTIYPWGWGYLEGATYSFKLFFPVETMDTQKQLNAIFNVWKKYQHELWRWYQEKIILQIWNWKRYAEHWVDSMQIWILKKILKSVFQAEEISCIKKKIKNAQQEKAIFR